LPAVGTWDTKTFDNDNAMDWVADLAEGDDPAVDVDREP
jgi:hypothetical protein